MKYCRSCRQANEDKAKYCSNCGNNTFIDNKDHDRIRMDKEGNRIKEARSEKSEKTSTRSLNILPIILLVIIVLLALFVFNRFQKNKEINSLESQALEYEEAQDYEGAYSVYDQLYIKTSKDDYRLKRDEMRVKDKYQEYLEDGNDYAKTERYIEAVNSYSKVAEDGGPLYDQAQDNIKQIEETLINEYQSYINQEDYQYVVESIGPYISIFSDSTKLKDLRNQAEDSLSQAEKAEIKKQREELASQERTQKANLAAQESKLAQERSKQAEQERKLAEEEARVNKRATNENIAWNILNTYQRITSSNANIRSGPGLGYGKIGNLSAGDEVYIYDTVVEPERIWCNIGDGWVSYNTMNGSLD